MKIRNGFVSNSSSSSFIVKRKYLSDEQINQLFEKCNKPFGTYKDTWEVTAILDVVTGFTSMRNNSPGENEGDLQDWLTDNGFPVSKFKWEVD